MPHTAVPGCQLPPTPVEPEKGVTAALPPKLTDTPWPTQTPEAAKTPKPTNTPKPTKTPEVAKTPRPTDTRQPTETPKPTDTPVPTSTPKPTDTPVPTSTPIPQDTTPPAVDITNVSPKVLLYGACSYDRILTVEAYVSDAESGVNQVFLVYRYVGVTGDFSVEMSPIGGGYYRAEVNIGDEAYKFLGGSDGSISITVVAYDGAGNEGRDSSGEVPVRYCPG